MKQMKKWIDRVSLVVFAVAFSVVLANLDELPQVAHIDSTGSLFTNVLCLILP